jgi:CO/xanthine dehydrogenase FAD-binding subunit
MRGYLPAYEMIRAKNLNEALRLLNQKKEELRCFAGGTDLMVLMAAGKLLKGKYLDISKIKELKNIKIKPNYIEIGALVTFSEIINHKVIQKEFPNLVQAARETGSIAIQNRGTIGGNIANASPAADTPPALISYNAEIELVSEKQKRTFLYSEYHTGYKTYVMQANEIIRCIRLPRIKKKRIHYYRKIGTRKAQEPLILRLH